MTYTGYSTVRQTIKRDDKGDFIVPTVETVSPDDLKNLLCAAFEGGINYWVDDVIIRKDDSHLTKMNTRPEGADYYYESVLYDCVLEMHDRVEAEECDNHDVWHFLRLKDLLEALPVAATHFGKSVKTFVEDHDSECADVWVQLAVFDNIVYG